DGQFSEDELIISKNVAFTDYVNGEFEFTENITVPLYAAAGNKVGLRIIGHYVDGRGGETACGVFDSGNALDYGVVIKSSSLGVSDLNDFQVKVYPNPVQSNLYIQTNGQETMFLEIFNSIGQKVFQKTYNKNVSLIKIPLDSFTDGLYFIRGKHNERAFTKKIIVKH
ncbi:T9SS type A sorting domain-containing protein, partial [Gelidibacter maritimus]